MSAKKTTKKVAKAPAKKMGRPSKFTEAIAAEVCERLSMGEPLAVICRGDKMPNEDTVRSWAGKNEELSRCIARARISGAHFIANRTRETARGAGDSTGDIARDKLIIDTDLKLLSKWFPKDYGDKLDLNANVTGDIRIIVGGDTA